MERLASRIREQIVEITVTYDRRRVPAIARLLGRLAGFKPGPVVVAGLDICIMALLDHAMISYGDVDVLVPPFNAVLATSWKAERLLEEIGWPEGRARGVYTISTCLIKDRCVYHLHDMQDEQDLLSLAAYLAFIAVVNDLTTRYHARMQCREPYDDCLKYVVEKLRTLARENGMTLSTKHLDMVTDPLEIYCTPDILAEHHK
jgi:hypothetical protein